ncbi:hypothetical protein PspLS_03601 [Pyricularia sp. CBS 133598]|nr:hypothetical protein PspLS_03601 [Pyricularia sp. CBS 133598]
MNQGHDMYYQQHMSAGPTQQPPTVTSYNPQPPIMQPSHGSYPAPPQPYGAYPYTNGMPSPQGPPVPGQMGPGSVLPSIAGHHGQAPGPVANQYSGFDTTGQIAPPGMKPRVTATLWEDEGSLCFQVEARGVCVARREDNHMINGTKLLNVAGMTRGRRDGILKSEKMRHVVKIGPMHLKGVWIPFERALDFANKEKITELLYPLFVHNISALLYHPANQNRNNQLMAAAERRKAENGGMRNPQGPPGLPALHHHSMSQNGSQSLPGNMGRPSLDRAHTFPTPPTSASSAVNMGSSDSFSWPPHQAMSNGQQNPMSIDTNLSNARSMPTTPATTPPGSTLQSMQAYPPASQSYDGSRQLYNAPQLQQSPYQPTSTSPQDRSLYNQATYVKSEMGPPSARPMGSVLTGDHQNDQKPVNGLMHPPQGGDQGHSNGVEDEADHEHDPEYTHDSRTYDNSQSQYNYTAPPVSSISSEQAHVSTDMPPGGQHGNSGRSTPRSAAAPQAYYQQAYSTSPRSATHQSTSNLYNVMSNDRGSTSNGSANGDVYSQSTDLSNGYATPVTNGNASLKRGRDDDDDRPTSGGHMDLKRRKTLMDNPISSPVYETMNRPAAAIAHPVSRRR